MFVLSSVTPRLGKLFLGHKSPVRDSQDAMRFTTEKNATLYLRLLLNRIERQRGIRPIIFNHIKVEKI